jgi:hypothetical protein
MTRTVTKAVALITFLSLQLLLIGISRGQEPGDACSNWFSCEGGKMVGTIPDCVCSKPPSCEANYTCPEGTLGSGEFPDCWCPIDQEKLPQPPTCEASWECVTDKLVGAGEWPVCGCVERDTHKRPGGGGGNGGGSNGIGSSMGGLDTCRQFFDCPACYKMILSGSNCMCEPIMKKAENSNKVCGF